MNRNVESHFSMLPHADIQRSRFDRSHSLKTTFNVGDVVPIYLDMDILPGDTVSIDTSKVVRLQTLLKPIFDNVYLDTYFFFVPNRLLWSHWKEFMGENTSSAWVPTTTYSVPVLNVTSSDVTVSGTLVDYLGIPVGVYGPFNALPIRAYSLVCDSWFRDENLTAPLVLNTGDANTTYSSTGTCEVGGALFKASKYHDYFTSCLPAPLKATQPVLTPVSGSPGIIANVGMNLYQHLNMNDDIVGTASTGNDYPLYGHFVADATNEKYSLNKDTTAVSGHVLYGVTTGATATSNNTFRPDNLYAYIPKNPAWPIGQTGSLNISISDLRNSFQIAKLLERDARSGTRYTEVIASHFGTTSPDSRLQRPEYLGGNRINISVHQVTNQTESTNEKLGNLGAFGMTTDRHSDFTYSATEHGIILGVCVARYDHTYSQGAERGWFRRNRFDYFWPALSCISEQPVYQDEIFIGTQSTGKTSGTFGYQEAWADYRYKPNRVTGEMRPDISNTLAVWHLSDDYASQPYLSDAWIREDKTNVDRVLAVQSSVSNQIMMDIAFNAWYTRPMPMYSIPGLVDHF